jgi:hypothetical protein
MSYHYKITSSYCYHESEIVDMYFINGVPFTFDELPIIMQDDPYVQIEAENNPLYSTEDMYNWSNYLIDEMCHPLLFDLEIENPEELPKD